LSPASSRLAASIACKRAILPSPLARFAFQHRDGCAGEFALRASHALVAAWRALYREKSLVIRALAAYFDR
jgi:hypothetical protein